MRRLFASILSAGCLFGCLQPQGENFIEIADASTITLELTETTTDTILIDRPTVFSYTVGGHPFQPISVSVTFDGNPSPAGIVGDNKFTVDPSVIPHGFHRMHVTVQGYNQNGSLANQLEFNTSDISNTFNVYVDSEPPEVSQILKFEITEGQLKVSWSKCKKQNFLSYTLKVCGDNNCSDVNIKDVNDTSWVDPNYVAGRIGYAVATNTTFTSVNGQFRYYEWKPNIRFQVSNFLATMRWGKFPFYNNIEKFRINSDSDFPKELMLEDTVITLANRLNFGYAQNFRLTAITKDGVEIPFTSEYFAGERINRLASFPREYNKLSKVYYGYEGASTVVMDINLNVIHYEYPMVFVHPSSSGEYVIGLYEGAFHKLDPLTLERTFLFQTGQLVVERTIVANNGLISFFLGGSTHLVINSTGIQIFSEPSGVAGELSPSGKYLISGYGRKVYRYDAGTFVLVGSLPTTVTVAGFDQNDNIICMGTDNQSVLYKAEPISMIMPLNLGSGMPLSVSIDPVSFKVNFSRESAYYFYDPVQDKYAITTSGFGKVLNDKAFAVGSGFDGGIFVINAEELFE
ncbi:MAG: hypothetical protein WKF87_10000 [Chryseolinea sp.]